MNVQLAEFVAPCGVVWAVQTLNWSAAEFRRTIELDSWSLPYLSG